MKTKNTSTKAGLAKGKQALRPSAKKLSAHELETVTTALELAEDHWSKATKKWPEGSAVRNLIEANAGSARRLLDLIQDGQFSFDFEGAQ